MELSSETQETIRRYLVRVDGLLWSMSGPQRRETMSRLEARIRQLLAAATQGRAATPQDAQDVLGRLGEPESVAQRLEAAKPPTTIQGTIAPTPATVQPQGNAKPQAATPKTPPPLPRRSAPAPAPTPAPTPAPARAFAATAAPAPTFAPTPPPPPVEDGGGTLRFWARVTDSAGVHSGLRRVEVTAKGVTLARWWRANRPEVLVPRGTPAAVQGKAWLQLKGQGQTMDIRVTKAGNEIYDADELVDSLAKFLGGTGAMPTAGTFAVPGWLYAVASLPAALVGVCWMLPAPVRVTCVSLFMVAMGVNMIVVKRREFPETVRAGIAGGIFALGALGLGVWWMAQPSSNSADPWSPENAAKTERTFREQAAREQRSMRELPEGYGRRDSSPPPRPAAPMRPVVNDLPAALEGLRSGEEQRQFEAMNWLVWSRPLTEAEARSVADAVRPLVNSSSRMLGSAPLVLSRVAQEQDVAWLTETARKARLPAGTRATAICSLIRLAPATGRDCVERCYADRGIQAPLFQKLAKLDARHEEALLPLLNSANFRLRREICGVLGAMGTARSIEAIDAARATITDRSEAFFYKSAADNAIARIRARVGN